MDAVFTVSFDVDVNGMPNPGTGDGTPDKYQTIFRYASAGNGTVTGQLLEVYTDDTHTAKPTAIPAAYRAVMTRPLFLKKAAANTA